MASPKPKLSGCNHFVEQKNEELMNNYRIIYSTFISCLYDSSKIAKKKLAVCHDCEFEGARLSSCLSCVYFACPTHLNEHFKNTQHSFGINITTGHLFCCHCDDYIYEIETLSIANEFDSEIYNFKKYREFISMEYIELIKSGNTIAYENNTPIPGFVNLGNTCFLNSVLQVLMHTPMLRNYILSDQHICPFVTEPSQCIICEISRIYQQAYALNVSVISLQNLLMIFWDNTWYMASALQQDAHECFIAILDIIHNQAIIQNENDKDIKHLENCQCIIHQIFKGVQQSDIICQKCNNVSSKIDIINDIPIFFSMDEKGKYPTNLTLMACLEQFGQIEFLNDLDCTNCQTKQFSSKQLTLKHLPMVLCFILKRFGQASDSMSNKITTVVEFPETLNMAKFMKKKTQTANDFINECFRTYETIYKLYAVICHEGLLNGGHYLSYIRHRGNWYQCNDNVVRSVQFEDILRSPAYLLFYHKEFLNYYS